MAVKRIGDVLRETRLQKGWTLEMMSKKTQVPQAYLLAMELNNFDALPRQSKSALELYSEALGLELADLHATEEAYQKEKEALLSARASAKEQEVVTERFRARSTRTGSKRQSVTYLPLLALILVSALIMVFMAVLVMRQIGQSQPMTSNSSTASSQEQAPSQSSSKPSSQAVSQTVTVTGGSEELVVTIKGAKEPISVVAALDGSVSEVWFDVTSSEVEGYGVSLSEEFPSAELTLFEGTSEALMTLGSKEGLSLKIAGKAIDLSRLSEVSPSYISIIIN